MSSYIILNYSIEDHDAFAAYQREARDYVLSGILDFLVYETRTEILEGTNVGNQTVIFRFPSKEEAHRFYTSKEYQRVLPMRLRSTSKHFAVLVTDRLPSTSAQEPNQPQHSAADRPSSGDSPASATPSSPAPRG